MYGIVPVRKICNVTILTREIGNVPILTREIGNVPNLMHELATFRSISRRHYFLSYTIPVVSRDCFFFPFTYTVYVCLFNTGYFIQFIAYRDRNEIMSNSTTSTTVHKLNK